MDQRIVCSYFVLFLLAFARCGQPPHALLEELSPQYQNVQKISAQADCLGPEGGYITTVTEDDAGSLIFEQVFTYKLDDFRVRIDHDTICYLLDTLDQPMDTLSTSVAWIIRSHHFHKMAAQPLDFFKDITKETTQDDPKGFWYTGKDPNGNDVRFRIYPNKKRLERLEVVNPEDPNELIVITYHSFLETIYGPTAQRVDIQQGNAANYIFQFKSILVNGEEMLVG